MLGIGYIGDEVFKELDRREISNERELFFG